MHPMTAKQSGEELAPIKPARIAQELQKLSAQRRAGKVKADTYDMRFAKIIHELRERRIDGGRVEVQAALKPLLDKGDITAQEYDRLLKQLGMA
jgi:hypothetical protein